MKILFSDLRRIQARMGPPHRCGDCYRAILDAQRTPLFQDFNSKFETMNTVDFVAQWGEDYQTHKPNLVWVLRGQFEIVFDCQLTRKKSVLP